MITTKKMLSVFLFVSLSATAFAQQPREKWVDSVFQTLNQNQKIGQLFFTRLSSHVTDDIQKSIERTVESGDIGGIIFTTGSVNRQAHITRRLQRAARVPLLISQDGRAGLGMLLDSAIAFPDPLAQGAIADDSVVYAIALETGRHMKTLGVHMSLSPNALPIYSGTYDTRIHYGDDRRSVERKSRLHMNALHDAGVLSAIPHFPLKSIGVIDQKGKSHVTLYHDTLVSAPAQSLFRRGLDAVMPDASALTPFFEEKRSDLKKKLTDGSFAAFESGSLIHRAIGFDGVVMIDVRNVILDDENVEPGDAGLLAFQAGADVLVIDDDPEATLRKIRKLVNAEERYQAFLDARVKKLLALKYDAGLSRAEPVNPDLLTAHINEAGSRVLRIRAYRESLTAIRNEKNVLPIRSLEEKNFTCMIAGDTTLLADIFHRSVRKYVRSSRLDVGEPVIAADLAAIDVILVALFPGTTPKAFQNVMGLLQETTPRQLVVVADFGCELFQPYADRFPGVIAAFTAEPDVVGMVPQAIFGGIACSGVLPLAYGRLASGTGVKIDDAGRLAYSFPEDAEIDGQTLEKIRAIAQEAISSGSTPGCYVLVARDGKVIYDNAFGHLTYDQKYSVTDETIYDLASLTKVSATLQAVMFMQERGLIDLYKKVSVYLPELRGTNKKDITMIDVLTHQSGLAPFIPLWPLTLEGPLPMPMYYSSQQDIRYPLQIAPSLFGSNVLKDSVYSWITYSKMLEKPQRRGYPYRYSDLGFMMFKQLAERVLNQPMEDFLEQNFYEPLGAYSLGYTPLQRFPATTIAPTELDTLFRRGLLIGTVHDERAAMLGGVSGHAGLFGTANDLSKLGQMLLQEGSYGGLQYYKPETVRLFTARQFASSRRGIGWDKPVVGEWNSPTSRYASPETFGHTGFTGTCLWVDPKFNLVYIFLSNRVFPDRSDKLIQTNIRSRIQDVIYEAIFNFCKTAESASQP